MEDLRNETIIERIAFEDWAVPGQYFEQMWGADYLKVQEML